MKLSIRTKLILFTVCVVLLVGGSIALYSFYQGRELIVTDFERDARETAALIAGSIANDLYRLDVHSLRVRIGSAVTNPDIRHIYVMDKEGVVLADSSNENGLRDKKLTDNFSREMLLAGNWISRLEVERLIVGGPVLLPDGEKIGYLQIGYSLDLMSQIVRGITRSSFQMTAIFLGVGVVLAVFLSVGFSRPIFSIMQASKEIGEGKLATRLSVNRADELGSLAESVNRMAEALQKRQIETEQKTRELQALYTLTNTISRSLNLDSCMQTALVMTIEVLKADAGRLYILEAKDRVLRLTAHHGLPTDQLSSIESYVPGEGIVGRTFKEKRPMVFADMHTDPKYAAMARGGKGKSWGFHSAAGLPITVKDQPVGVIYIYGRAVREFTQQDVELLSAIGDQIGVALENARLFQETEQQSRQQEALNVIAKATSQSLRRDELLKIALDKVLEVTGRERVSIRLKDSPTGQVTLAAHRGFSQEEIENLLQRQRARHQPTEQVLASGQPLVINNRLQLDNSLSLLPQSQSVAWIPMKAGAQVVGILGISASSPVPFSEREVEFLQAIANMIGVALENARLFSETEARYRELQTLHSISSTILDSLDLKVTMERILDQALDIGKFDVGVIRLFDPKDETLGLVASRGYRDPENVQGHLKRLEGYTTGVGTARVMKDKAVHVVDLSQISGMRTFKKEGVRTLVVVPLRGHEDVLGVIQLGSRAPREFQASELRILEAIGGQAGIAIQKARLYEQSRRAQAALAEKAEELARSNTELQHFAYIASHDLQEPLRMVASYVQLLARRYQGKLDGEANEFIAYAVDGATRMQALINALLAYSRIGSKGKPFEAADCEKIIGVALKNLQMAIEESQAVVTHNPLPTVMGDATQLGQLLQNLIGNAIKFRGEKPPAIHVSAERNGKDWYFSCRDNGIGIDPQFSERIFVVFQRLHSKEEYPGTGIGLALCKKIVERHGGRIWLESEPGKGATFRFTLPV